MLLLTSDCSDHLVTLPTPLIRCLCVDFVRVTNCFYDYVTITDYSDVMRSIITNFNDQESKISKRNLYSK